MSKQIAAKFYIAEVNRKAYGGSTPYGSVVLTAVTRKDGDNKQWASATPSGRLEMTVHSEALLVFNEHIGKDVELLMTIVDTEEPTS